MEEKYTFWQQFRAAFLNTNATWLYATPVEKLVIEFKNLSEDEKKEFLTKISK